MSSFYKVFLEFKGSRFLGWQIQKDFSPTVQGEFNKACSEIFKSNEIHTIGSGRTDTGVHSISHVVKLKAPFEIPNGALLKALNSKLNRDIRVNKIESCSEDFLPTNNALKKEYKYLFTNNDNLSAFQSDFIENCRFDLDIEKMKKACEIFIGEHDFKDFQCTGTNVSSTTREIFECELYFHELDFHGVLPGHFVFRVVGSGFLKQMVRQMVGTLWSIGRGKTTLNELEQSLQKPSGKRLGITAPPSGLYKTKVWY